MSFILNDAAGNSSSTYATAISQGSDAIDANSPTISSVSIPNSSAKVGDAITVTITAGETGLSLSSGEVNGVTVTSFTDNSDNTYSATYTVVEGNTDRAAGDNIPVAFILNDAAGNSSSTFVTAISQGSDAIDANSPAAPVVSSPSSASRVNAASQTISGTHGEDGATINAYTDSDNNGVADNSTSLGSAVVSGGAWSFSVNLSADTDNNFVVVAEDGAGNQSSAVDVSTITEDSTGPNITSLGLNNSNAFIEIFTNEGVYNTNGGSGGLEISDIDISISGGSATDPVITSLKDGSDGTSDLTGGESIIRVNFTTTGVADGSETVTINFADGSSVFDAVGNASAATQSNNTRTLNDLINPYITGVSLAADNSYIDVTFNEAVYQDNCVGAGLEPSDFDLQITGGSASLNAITSVTKTDGNALSGGETSVRINFTLTGTPDGDETLEVDLQDDGVYDQNGLEAAADQTSNNTATLNDKAAPTVLEMSSDVNNSSFKVGANINIYVQYSEEVFVTGTPQLTLETGATDRTIDYVDRSSSTLRFVYTVQAGDVSSDLDVQSTSALTLNGGTIKDAAGNNAVLTLPVDPDGSALTAKNLVIDGVVPTVTSVTSSSSDGSFKIGDQVNVQVVFSEAVTVSDYTQLQLQLETGDSDYYIASQSGSGTTTINFTYTVQSGTESSDLEYLATNSLEVSLSGSVKDAVGNDANLTLPTIGGGNSLSDNKALVIDGIVPSFENSTPTVSNIKQTEFDLSLDLDEAGTFYYVVLANDANAPTSAEVKAGTGASGGATVTFGSASAAPDFFTTALGGVGVTSASTAYDLYVVAEDAAGNLQSSPVKVDITTIAAPTVTLSVDNSSIAENGGTATLTATLSAASSQDVTVSLSYSGTAINATDYNNTASSTITITAGQTSADAGTIITAIDNNVDAADKTIEVAITTVTNGTEDGDQEVSITIADDDNSPVITASQSFTVDEDATDATVVGNVLATDADAGTTFSNWTITAGNGDGVFAINSSTGQLVVNDKTNLDFETTESYTLTLTVTDGSNLSASEDVTINVNDLNDNDPVVTASQTFSVNDNAANSTSVGTVAASDADANTTLSGWSITAGNDDGVFAINSSTGEITVSNNTNLDYDVTTSYSLTVTVTDGTNTSSGQTVTINVNKVSGITITESSGSTATTEAGGTDSFTVVLDVQPSSDVVLNVSVGDATEGSVDKSTLTFTTLNWNVPQTVTITGEDDDIIDGTVNYDITISVVDASSDDNYDSEADQTVNVNNTDDDLAGFTITQSNGNTATTEAGGTDSFTVELDAEPNSDVVINVTSGDTGEATADVAVLTFTAANWDTPQTVTLTGVDDDIIDGTQTFNVTLSIDDNNSDDNFDPLGDQTVSVDNSDDDVAGFTVTESDG
ncbi:MAG: cadherin repeat domain-containing protein, partial [Oceanospirillaceae bacterium]|nr:cadherin repeat domain-containing protein [Oceanospirillaceae bacterium]